MHKDTHSVRDEQTRLPEKREKKWLRKGKGWVGSWLKLPTSFSVLDNKQSSLGFARLKGGLSLLCKEGSDGVSPWVSEL